jgi:hypothetical protein
LRKPFVIIDAEILNSSIWMESPATKLVWFTLLILCDTEGYVGASVPGLAHQAGVSLEDCRAAVDTLLSPDPHSRTKEHEGRRIEVADRGWRIINFQSVLDRMASDRTKNRDRVRRHRERNAMKRDVTPGNGDVPTGRREQGEGNREEGSNGISISPPVQSEQAVDPRKTPDTGMSPEEEQEYADEVVSAICQRRGSELPLQSNTDIAEIRRWLEDGVPLRIALRGIQDCSKAPPRAGAAYYGPAVREAFRMWQRMLA